jgi:hypothetical protein
VSSNAYGEALRGIGGFREERSSDQQPDLAEKSFRAHIKQARDAVAQARERAVQAYNARASKHQPITLFTAPPLPSQSPEEVASELSCHPLSPRTVFKAIVDNYGSDHPDFIALKLNSGGYAPPHRSLIEKIKSGAKISAAKTAIGLGMLPMDLLSPGLKLQPEVFPPQTIVRRDQDDAAATQTSVARCLPPNEDAPENYAKRLKEKGYLEVEPKSASR